MNILKTVSSWLNLDSRPQLPQQPQEPRAADVYRQATDTLQTVYDRTTFKFGKTPEELRTPAIGASPLQFTSEDGRLHASLDGQELPSKHRAAERFYSSSGALGTDPADDTFDLPGGRHVTVKQWDHSWELRVQQDNAPVYVDMWFHESSSPSSVSFRQPGLEACVSARKGLQLEEHTQRDGPIYGHLTELRDGQFKSRDWRDGFSDPAQTTDEDVARVLNGSRELLSSGGALFAQR